MNKFKLPMIFITLLILFGACTSSNDRNDGILIEMSQTTTVVVATAIPQVNYTSEVTSTLANPSFVLETPEPNPDQNISELAQVQTQNPSTNLGEINNITPTEIIREMDQAIEIQIPAGEFFFGCDAEHNGGFECLPDELPVQVLYLDAFNIDKFEVTNAQYTRCVESGICPRPLYTNSATRESYYDNSMFANYPVIGITWNEALAYCTWVGGRLPTEAEWEKAARGRKMQSYPWGDEEPTCDLANMRDDQQGECVGDTVPVGSYPLGASPYGVMDMAGNVWEWVMDYYIYNASGHLINIDPLTKGLDYNRIIKGGSFDYTSYTLRIAYNSDHAENERKISFGFRCLRPAN